MFEKKDKRDILLVILPCCDYLGEHGASTWKTLDTMMREISRSYVAISLNVEVLICGMTTLEDDCLQDRLDFFTKATKFQTFENFWCSYDLLHECKDDVEALHYARQSIATRHGEHYPKYVEVAKIGDHVDRKTWMYSKLLDGTLQTTEQFLASPAKDDRLPRKPASVELPLKSPTSLRILSFISRPVDIPGSLKRNDYHILVRSII